MKYCEKCGAKLLDDDVYCVACGELQADSYDDLKNNYCEECGAKIESGDVFCTECGKRIEEYPQIDLTLSDTDQNEPISFGNEPNKKRQKDSNKIMHIVIIVLVVLIVCIGIFLFYYVWKNNTNSSDQNISTQTAVENTTETTQADRQLDYNLYRSVLEKYQNSSDYSEYFFNDLNADDIYELFVCSSNNYSNTLEAYTIENGSILELGDINYSDAYISICQNSEMFLIAFDGESGLISQIILKDGKIDFKEIDYNKSGSGDSVEAAYDYLKSKKEVIYDIAEIHDYSLLESVINGDEINTEFVSYDDYAYAYDSEMFTEHREETTTEINEINTMESTTEVMTKVENNIKIPETPLELKLKGISDEYGTIEITDLQFNEYGTYITGYIKNTGDKTIKSLRLVYKVYDKKGVCINNSFISESDMSVNETRKIEARISVDDNDEISEIEFDVESSYIYLR